MKKSVFWMGLIALALCLTVTFLAGCATKEAGVKSDSATTQDQKGVTKGGASSMDAKAAASAKERELRDQALRQAAAKEATAKEAAEQAKREAAAKEAAAKEAAARGKDATEQAKKEAATKAAAVLKDLQIPDVNFEYDKHTLTPSAQAILKAGAPAYLKYREYKLVVEGHCDERGTLEYNLALGQKRAEAAAKYLNDMGIEKERIKTISYGKEMPLDPASNDAAWARNRRAKFVIFPPVK